jgi:hypothetical protein
VRQPGSSHRRFVDCVDPAGVAYQEPGKEGVTPSERGETLRDPVTHGVAQDHDRRPRAGYNREGADVDRPAMASAPDRARRPGGDTLDFDRIPSGGEDPFGEVDQDRPPWQADQGIRTVPACDHVGCHHSPSLDRTVGERFQRCGGQDSGDGGHGDKGGDDAPARQGQTDYGKGDNV